MIFLTATGRRELAREKSDFNSKMLVGSVVMVGSAIYWIVGFSTAAERHKKQWHLDDIELARDKK